MKTDDAPTMHIHDFLEQASRDEEVYITDVREAFARQPGTMLRVSVVLYSGEPRDFFLNIPPWKDQTAKPGSPASHTEDENKEKNFIKSYLYAFFYNVLSVLGARKICIYMQEENDSLRELLRELNEVFQTGRPISERSGYGTCLNANQRILAYLNKGSDNESSNFGAGCAFEFEIHTGENRNVKGFCGYDSTGSFREQERETKTGSGKKISDMPAKQAGAFFENLMGRPAGKLLLGMDIGGSDIKLAVSLDGKLILLGEYNWNPAEFTRASELTEPVAALTRMMRSAASLYAKGRSGEIIQDALRCSSSLKQVKEAAGLMEQAAGMLRKFDGIGLSFPDIVIDNHILGGQTTKTRGMRENPNENYEEQFKQISALTDELEREFTVGPGTVHCTNDGTMAAFTAAVENAAEGRADSNGFFSCALGSELGSGWILSDGSVPRFPLEIYHMILDLGSFGQREYARDDARSIRDVTNSLPGGLQKYVGQMGAFRLAAKTLGGTDIWRRALRKGLFRWEDGHLIVPLSPQDRRKGCLAFLMDSVDLADLTGHDRKMNRNNPNHREQDLIQNIFRRIGVYLAYTMKESDYLLAPECRDRTLFGRLVKDPGCARLIVEGARQIDPDRNIRIADEVACSPLMRQLRDLSREKFAQFAQAVGSLYYAVK